MFLASTFCRARWLVLATCAGSTEFPRRSHSFLSHANLLVMRNDVFPGCLSTFCVSIGKAVYNAGVKKAEAEKAVEGRKVFVERMAELLSRRTIDSWLPSIHTFLVCNVHFHKICMKMPRYLRSPSTSLFCNELTNDRNGSAVWSGRHLPLWPSSHKNSQKKYWISLVFIFGWACWLTRAFAKRFCFSSRIGIWLMHTWLVLGTRKISMERV